MSGNRSLDEFGGAGGAEEDGVAPESNSEAGPADEEPSGESDADPTAESGHTGDEVDDGVGVDAEAGASPDSASDEDTQPEASVTDDADEPADPIAVDEPVDRPASTYRWSPDGAACGSCGETVEERWRDGDDLVCAGCKEW